MGRWVHLDTWVTKKDLPCQVLLLVSWYAFPFCILVTKFLNFSWTHKWPYIPQPTLQLIGGNASKWIGQWNLGGGRGGEGLFPLSWSSLPFPVGLEYGHSCELFLWKWGTVFNHVDEDNTSEDGGTTNQMMSWNTVALPALDGSPYLGYLCYITVYSMINMSSSCVGFALLFLDTLKHITLSHCCCFFHWKPNIWWDLTDAGLCLIQKGFFCFPLIQCFLPVIFAPAASVASGNFSEKQILCLPNPELLSQKLWAQPCVLHWALPGDSDAC